MSMQRFRDEFGDLFVYGTGYVTRDFHGNIYEEGQLFGNPMLYFSVVTKIKSNKYTGDDGKEKTKYTYERIRCIIRGGRGNPFMYALAKTFKQGDRIEFKGMMKEYTFTSEDGEKHMASDLVIESFIMPDRLSAMLLGKPFEARQSKIVQNENRASGKAAHMEKNANKNKQSIYDFD